MRKIYLIFTLFSTMLFSQEIVWETATEITNENDWENLKTEVIPEKPVIAEELIPDSYNGIIYSNKNKAFVLSNDKEILFWNGNQFERLISSVELAKNYSNNPSFIKSLNYVFELGNNEYIMVINSWCLCPPSNEVFHVDENNVVTPIQGVFNSTNASTYYSTIGTRFDNVLYDSDKNLYFILTDFKPRIIFEDVSSRVVMYDNKLKMKSTIFQSKSLFELTDKVSEYHSGDGFVLHSFILNDGYLYFRENNNYEIVYSKSSMTLNLLSNNDSFRNSRQNNLKFEEGRFVGEGMKIEVFDFSGENVVNENINQGRYIVRVTNEKREVKIFKYLIR